MKSICITGFMQSSLNQVHAILEAGGMQAQKAVQRTPIADLQAWHAGVMSSAAEDTPAGQAVRPSGRLWEQLASDLFLANLGAPVWGWADPDSTWLLDYWQEFEPKLYFVLVCVSPQTMLAQMMAAGAGMEAMETAQASWQAHHQEMLRFHLRHPQRSILVDAGECVRHPELLLNACATRWHLPLAASADLHAATQNDSSEALASYLNARLYEAGTYTGSLQQELDATVLRLSSEENLPPPDSLPQAIAAYHDLASARVRLGDSLAAQADLAEQNRALSDLASTTQAALEQANIELHSEQEKGQRIQVERHRLQGELDAALRQRASTEAASVAAADAARRQEAETSRLQDAEQENNLLLLQLHQVQEELERQFTRNQQLHADLEQAERRWHRLLSRQPDYHDYLSLDLSASGNGGVDFQLREFNAAGRNLACVDIHGFLENGMGGLQLRRDGGSGPLLRWPAGAEDQDTLTLIPSGSASNAHQRLRTLIDLSSSDWDLLKTLGRVLGDAAGRAQPQQLPAGLSPAALSAGLTKFSATLLQFPPILRYDQVSLVREQVNPDYEHLWIGLDNLTLGELRCARFEFRLSCGNVRPQRFGTHPKLEFPQETGQAPFEAWYAETADDFGDKLELRFATPDAMDMAVWQQLSVRDHILLLALSERLPAILSLLEAQRIPLKRSWQDWRALAGAVHAILTQHGAPAGQPAEQKIA